MKDILKQLPWRIAVVLVLIEFIRPMTKTVGHFAGYTVDPAVVHAMTIIVAIIWVGTVVIMRIKHPIHFLAACGVLYAWLSIAVAVIIQIIAPGSGDDVPSIPVLLSAGLVAATLYNLVQGIVLGIVARALQFIFKRQ